MKPPIKPAASSPVFGSDAAPIIYFDGIVAFGAHNGIVQLELACNQLVPTTMAGNEVKTKIVVTAHLRCSPAAAANLRDVIDKMLAPTPTKQ